MVLVVVCSVLMWWIGFVLGLVFWCVFCVCVAGFVFRVCECVVFMHVHVWICVCVCMYVWLLLF